MFQPKFIVSFIVKILFVITRSDIIGGASVHLLELAKGLNERNHQTKIVVGGNGLLLERARALDIVIQPLKNLVRQISLMKDIAAYFELRDVIRDYKPDLVHLHSSKAGIIGRLACSSLNVPCIFTAHGWSFTEGVSSRKRSLFLFMEKITAKIAKRIITVSDYDRNLAISHGVSSEKCLVTVHNGVSDKLLEAKSVKKNAVVQFIMVARFEEQKDQRRLLLALSKITDLQWKLQFVGDGPNLAVVESMCYELGLLERVSFPGACYDIAERLYQSDVFVLLSNWEGLPLTILEAMSAGLPIIASDVGGVKETIDDSCGVLISSKDDLLLIDTLRQFIMSTDMRAQFGSAARKRYLELFTLERMIVDIEGIYLDVLDKK